MLSKETVIIKFAILQINLDLIQLWVSAKSAINQCCFKYYELCSIRCRHLIMNCSWFLTSCEWVWVTLWVLKLFLQGARLSVALVSSISIRALITGIRVQDASLRRASRSAMPGSWCLGWGRDCSHLRKKRTTGNILIYLVTKQQFKKKKKTKTYIQAGPAGYVSTEHPAPDDWLLWKLDWFVWRNGDFLPPFSRSAGGQGDFPLVTFGSALHLLGDGSRSGWCKRLQTC